MQLYLEKDLMNISRNIQLSTVEDVLIKVITFLVFIVIRIKNNKFNV